jgi:hypothetical protein
MKNRLQNLFLSAGLLMSTACSVFGNNGDVNEPPYTLIQENGPYQVRRYDPMILAQVSASGSMDKASNKAFRPLFNYIDGNNSTQTKVPMTSPVLQEPEAQSDTSKKIPMTAPVFMNTNATSDQQWTMSFVMPASFTLQNTPQPLDPKVNIVKQDARMLAVVTFDGLAKPEERQEKGAEVKQWAASAGYTTVGDAFYAGYNPPFTLPAFRRNEMLIEVKK